MKHSIFLFLLYKNKFQIKYIGLVQAGPSQVSPSNIETDKLRKIFKKYLKKNLRSNFTANGQTTLRCKCLELFGFVKHNFTIKNTK